MALDFSAVNAYLVNTAAPVPSAIYPLAIGMWVRPATLGTARRYWSLCDPSSNDNYIYCGQSGNDQWNVAAIDPTSNNGANTPMSSVIIGAWSFILARFLATNQRAIDVLPAGGGVLQATTSNTRTPSGMTQMGLGYRASLTPGVFFDGLIGEFWWGVPIAAPLSRFASLPEPTLRQLAYGGPFSIPSVAASIREYRSFRTNPVGGEGRDIHVGSGVPWQNWSNVNGVTTGPHPPLSTNYRCLRRNGQTIGF